MDYTDLMNFSSPQMKVPTPSGRAMPEESAPQPESPAPEQASPPPEAPQKADPSDYGSLMGLSKPAERGNFAPGVGGTTPMSAEPESPLGLVDRARMGFLRTPAAQMNFLEDKFGKDNVKLTDSSEGKSFVVKDKSGAWKQADPAFEWKFSGAGAAMGALTGGVLAGPAGLVAGGIAGAISPSFTDKKNLKDLPGDVAQFGAEYGPRAWAAGQGAMMAAPTGPLGMIAGAAIGATSMDSLETGAKYGATKLGLLDPKAVPQTVDELHSQLWSSALFGATQELGALVGQKLFTTATKFVAKSLDALTDTPTGQWFARKGLSVITGRPESEAAIRVADPKSMVPFDEMARADDLNNTDKVGSYMKAKVQAFMDKASSAKRVLFKGYDAVESEAGKLSYAPTEPAQKVLGDLADQGYLQGSAATDYNAAPTLSRKLSQGDKGIINYISTQAKIIGAMAERDKPIPYKKIQEVMQTLGSELYQRDNITDLNLRRIVQDFQSGLKNHTLDVIKEKAPALAEQLAMLDAKYGPLKEMLNTLASKSDAEHVDTFVKQILKDNGSFNSTLVSQISEMLGVADPTKDILRAHVARNSTALWGGKKIMGLPLGSPRVGAELADTVSKSKTIPYLQKFVGMLKDQTPEGRKALLTDPKYLTPILQTLSGAAAQEDQTTDNLLKQAGVK